MLVNPEVVEIVINHPLGIGTDRQYLLTRGSTKHLQNNLKLNMFLDISMAHILSCKSTSSTSPVKLGNLA